MTIRRLVQVLEAVAAGKITASELQDARWLAEDLREICADRALACQQVGILPGATLLSYAIRHSLDVTCRVRKRANVELPKATSKVGG